MTAWAGRGSGRERRIAVGTALALSLVIDSVLMLPVVPAGRLALPAGARVVVLTGNYGEAGAIDRFAPDLGPAYSGHNSCRTWEPPPEDADAVIAVGLSGDQSAGCFGQGRSVGRFDDGVGLENDEQGVPILVATDRRLPWSEIWPELRRLGRLSARRRPRSRCSAPGARAVRAGWPARSRRAPAAGRWRCPG